MRAFEQDGLTPSQSLVQQNRRVTDKRRDLLGRCGVLRVHFVGVERFGIEQRVRDHVLLAHRVFDVLFQKLQIEQIRYAKPAAAHLVFVGRTDSARGGADLHASRSILRRQLDHAMVGQNHLRAVRNKEISVDSHARFAQRAHFL